VIFLLAVFSVFVGIGIANDVIEMGRQPAARFAASAVLSGLFAVFYAGTAIALRGKFWKALLPLFVLQFLIMGSLGRWFPDVSRAIQLNPAETGHLHNRMIFDGCGIIASVVLG